MSSRQRVLFFGQKPSSVGQKLTTHAKTRSKECKERPCKIYAGETQCRMFSITTLGYFFREKTILTLTQNNIEKSNPGYFFTHKNILKLNDATTKHKKNTCLTGCCYSI